MTGGVRSVILTEKRFLRFQREDVKLANLIVIHRGAEAWGIVMAVKPKARKGLAGILDVSIQSTQLLTGKPVPLRAVEILGRKKMGSWRSTAELRAPKTAVNSC